MISILLLLISTTVAPAHAQKVDSCATPIYAVQEDEIYVNESKVHSGNLQAPTAFRHSLFEFDEISELTNPAILGVVNADAQATLDARLIAIRKGKEFYGPTKRLTIRTSEPLTSEYEGKKITYRAFDTGSTLLSLFRDSATPEGEYKLELTASTASIKCSVIVPLRVD